MLFNLLLANKKVLLCFFFLFLTICNNFFIISVVKQSIKLKLALTIYTGTPITLTKETIDISLLVADKIIKVLPKKSKAAKQSKFFTHYFSFFNS